MLQKFEALYREVLTTLYYDQKTERTAAAQKKEDNWPLQTQN